MIGTEKKAGVDAGRDSTDDPVGHAYGGNLVTSAPSLNGAFDLGSVERHDAGQHRGGVRHILFTSPTTQCGLQAAARRVVERALWVEARSTGSHCGGQTTGWSTSASLLATQGFAVFGMKAAQKAAATPMRTNARDLDACFFAYRLRSGGGRVRSGAWQVRGGCMGSWHGVCMTSRAWEVHYTGYSAGCESGLSAGAARGAKEVPREVL